MPEPLAPSPDLESGAAPVGVETNVESGVDPAPSAVRSRRVPDRVWSTVCAAVGVTTGLWITRHAWGPHLIAGGDVTADLIRANFGIAQIVAHGRLDGWFPRFMEGDQEFLFNGPGVTWAIAFLRLLSLGALSNAGALKVLAIGSIAAEPLAVAYLARSFGLNRISAGIAGIISFTATAGYGGSGLEGLFVNGLLSHQLGAIPFFISFGALLRVFDDPSRRRMVVAGTALAVLVITHLISVMILAVMFPIALIFRMSASQRSAALRGLGGVLGAGGVAFGIAGFWVVPFLVHRNLHGPVVTWGTDPFDVRIAQILRGQILYEPFMAKLVILAWIVTILRAAFGQREHVVLLAVPAIYLVIAHVTLSYPGPGDISLQLANRGLAYAGVIALFPVAALVGLAVTRLGDLSGDQYIAILLCAFAVMAAVIVTVGHSNEHLAGQLTTPTPALRDAAAELRGIVPSGARFSMTRDYPAEIARVGVIEPERWLAWASGVDTLNAFNPEASNAGAVAYTADGPANNQTIDSWVRALRRLGVSHIVVDKPALDKQMQASALVHQVWTQGPVTIYEVLTDSGGTPPNSDGHRAVQRRREFFAEGSRTAAVDDQLQPTLHLDDRGGVVAQMARHLGRPERQDLEDLRRPHADRHPTWSAPLAARLPSRPGRPYRLAGHARHTLVLDRSSAPAALEGAQAREPAGRADGFAHRRARNARRMARSRVRITRVVHLASIRSSRPRNMIRSSGSAGGSICP